MTSHLRIMTMNLGTGSGEPYVDFTAQAHCRFINRVNPDIVFLQEVDRRTNRASGVDQLAVLSQGTALSFRHFVKYRDFDGGESGMGIISKFPLENAQDRSIYWWVAPLPPRLVTTVPYATINLSGATVHLYCTHFPLDPFWRKWAADRLAAAIHRVGPTVLGGDFNGGPGDAEFTAIDRRFAAMGEPCPHVNIELKYDEAMIDHILWDGGIACATYTRVSAEELPRGRFSDHGMLYVDLLMPLPSGRVVAKHSGKSLDVRDGSTANGASIQQWDYLGGDNQKWRLEPLGDRYYRIVAKHSGKSLDVRDGSTANGALIQQWDYLGGDNQRFLVSFLP